MKIKWKIFAYLSVFVFLIVAFLWVFQTVFLNEFYRMIKTNSVHAAAKDIASKLESDTLNDTLASYYTKDDMYIQVVDRNFNKVDTNEQPRQSMTKHFSLEQKEQWIQEADEIGTLFQTYLQSEIPKKEEYIGKNEPDGKFKGDEVKEGPPKEKKVGEKEPENVLYIQKAQLGQKAVYIVIDTMITPLDSAITTLRVQLIYATVVLIIGAGILTWILSNKIANPIVKTNSKARQLATGDYSVSFEGNNYLEIAQLTDTLNYAVTELKKTERLQRELIANISHDLRTPLTMITGYSEAMRDLPGENSPENLQLVIDEANRLSRLVTDVLDISKLQSGTQELRLEKVNLTKLVKRVMERCGKLIEKDGYQLEFVAAEEVFVNADEVRLQQVVYNLLSNAITYTGEDRQVFIGQTVTGNKVRIAITDTGPGIEEEHLEDIWNRYYKINSTKTTHKRTQVGSGLGLSIVKQIITLLKGECGVVSTVGQGSTFWFELDLLK